jgi:hypothetical protein
MAVTRYETRADATNEVSFVELWPWTGRKHQLRVHCAEVLKAPILGDDKYGSREAFDRFELMLDNIDNLHLHCRSLEIPHPIKENQRCVFFILLPACRTRTAVFTCRVLCVGYGLWQLRRPTSAARWIRSSLASTTSHCLPPV